MNQYLTRLQDIAIDIAKIEDLLKPEVLQEEKEKLEYLLNDPNSWSNVNINRQYSSFQNQLKEWEYLNEKHEELEEIIRLSLNEDDYSLENEVKESCLELEILVQKMQLRLMFEGEYDSHNVILSIHAGAGGREAQDWASMLLRMYLRWADKHNFISHVLDVHTGEEPKLIKSATAEIIGRNVYGMLKNENGVHRLVRVSPFDAQSRRHTSFAAVEVIPEITPDMNIEIDPKDLQIDKFRSSGAGGQHVNTTESAVRITHLPTGIVVTCQNERSQHQNQDQAMKVLLSKLVQIKEQEHLDTISDIVGGHKSIEWGSQIRSYVFMPHQLVKDHRTDYETGNIDAVMDGNIDEFIFKNLAY